MVEMAIKANQESIKKVDALMKRMDETHARLKERSGNKRRLFYGRRAGGETAVKMVRARADACDLNTNRNLVY